MTVFLNLFILLSAMGLTLSFILHVTAYLGIDLGLGKNVNLFFIGIFIVWLPTVIIANKNAQGGKQSDFWKIAMIGCPDWMKKMTFGIFYYAIFNFILSMIFLSKQSPNHTGIPTLLELRLMSGHEMVFYSAALAVLYSAKHTSKVVTKCPNGHDVSPLANYCDECGSKIIKAAIRF